MPAVAASERPGHRPRLASGRLRPLPRAQPNTLSGHQMPAALFVALVLIIMTLCAAAAATRFGTRRR